MDLGENKCFFYLTTKATSWTACAKAHGQKELLVCLKIYLFCIQLFNFGLLFQDSELGPINRPGDHRYSANVREQPPNGLGQSGVLPLQQESKLFRHEPRRHYFFHLHLLVDDCWNKICRLLYILLYLEQYSVKTEVYLVSKASKYTKKYGKIPSPAQKVSNRLWQSPSLIIEMQ